MCCHTTNIFLSIVVAKKTVDLILGDLNFTAGSATGSWYFVAGNVAENVLALCFYVFSYLALYLHLSVITCLALQHCLHHRTAPPQASEPEFFSSWKKGFLESFCEKSVKSDGVDHSQRIIECGIRIICWLFYQCWEIERWRNPV